MEPLYSRANPFLARIKERYLLCKPASGKRTFHLVIDIGGSGMSYQVGDSLAVQPTNIPYVVENTLRCLHATGDEIVFDKNGIAHSLRDMLIHKVNLADVPRKLVGLLAERQTNSGKQALLEAVQRDKERFKVFLNDHEVWDLLAEHPEVRIDPQELCQILQPLLPRFYSIASSSHVFPNEVHLTVAALTYETNQQMRYGICTHYLCFHAPLNADVVPVYIQPSQGFTIPEDHHAGLIMIGPGTGVAPYRGFMQERIHKGAKGKHWLFFGDRNRATDFLYEEYWQELLEQGHLRVETAFSRDQEEKVYVHHRMLEHGKDCYEWLEEGAYLFVCGDAQKMAKDVDAAIHQIVQLHGKLDEDQAREYIKRLKAQKRYLRDVY